MGKSTRIFNRKRRVNGRSWDVLTQVLCSEFCYEIDLLATDFFFQILAHPVFKMRVIQKPKKVAL